MAGTVGLMMAKILNVHKKQSLKSAIDLGIAMQLTNISRDVMEDKKNNRFYINERFEDIKNTIKLSEQFYKNSGKIYVSNIEKIIETFLSIFDLIKLSLISKNDANIQHDHD